MGNDLQSHNVAAVALALGHLAEDPDLLDRTGQTLTAGDLARYYDFTDVDGTQPEPFALG